MSMLHGNICCADAGAWMAEAPLSHAESMLFGFKYIELKQNTCRSSVECSISYCVDICICNMVSLN